MRRRRSRWRKMRKRLNMRRIEEEVEIEDAKMKEEVKV